MPETYTLKYKNLVKGRDYASRYKIYDIYNDIDECLKQEKELLKSFNSVQIIKNSKGDEK